MKIIMQTKTVVIEERELKVTEELCNRFNSYIKEGHLDNFEDITIDDIDAYDLGLPSRFDQTVERDNKYYPDEQKISEIWDEWISEELWGEDPYEVDGECTNQDVYVERY